MACIFYPVHGYCSPKSPSSCLLLVRDEGSCGASIPPERRSLRPCCRFVARTCSFTTPTRCTTGGKLHTCYHMVLMMHTVNWRQAYARSTIPTAFPVCLLAFFFVWCCAHIILHVLNFFSLLKKNIIWRKGGESVVDIQTALWAERSEVRLLAGARYVYFLRNFHTGCGAPPIPLHPMGKAVKAWSLQPTSFWCRD